MEDKSNSLKLKRHDTFSIREGWLEKVINIFPNEKQCFSKDKGQQILGIGTNMVKSLRYWSEACNLIKFSQKENKFTELGEYLHDRDPFLSDLSSWWLIHLFLATNFSDAPVFNYFFNMPLKKFDKEQLFNQIKTLIENDGYSVSADSSLEADINMLIKSYYSDDFSNPENNMNCPLAKLNLIGTSDKRIYTKLQPKYASLSYKVVYYALLLAWKKENEKQDKKMNAFNLEDMYEWKNNPINIFNLSKTSFYQYLDEMSKNNLIKLIKTAGLNVVTIEVEKNLNELF